MEHGGHAAMSWREWLDLFHLNARQREPPGGIHPRLQLIAFNKNLAVEGALYFVAKLHKFRDFHFAEVNRTLCHYYLQTHSWVAPIYLKPQFTTKLLVSLASRRNSRVLVGSQRVRLGVLSSIEVVHP